MPDQQVPRSRLLLAAAGWELVQRPSVVTTGEDKAKFAYYERLRCERLRCAANERKRYVRHGVIRICAKTLMSNPLNLYCAITYLTRMWL